MEVGFFWGGEPQLENEKSWREMKIKLLQQNLYWSHFLNDPITLIKGYHFINFLILPGGYILYTVEL